MFGFISMMYNYDDRKVARDEFEWGFVSTCSVNDGTHPYETGISHREYNDGHVIVVEAYESVDEAVEGHGRWLETLNSAEPPESLTDCKNAEISKMISETLVYPRKVNQ